MSDTYQLLRRLALDRETDAVEYPFRRLSIAMNSQHFTSLAALTTPEPIFLVRVGAKPCG
jgi:hypothetical protein